MRPAESKPQKYVRLQGSWRWKGIEEEYIQYRIAIPRSVVEDLGWKKGDVLEWQFAFDPDGEPGKKRQGVLFLKKEE